MTFVVKGAVEWLEENADTLAILTGAKEILIVADYMAPKGTPVTLTDVGEVYLPLEGLIDVAAEKIRLTREIIKVEQELTKSESKLASPTFVDRAPPEVVAQEQARLGDWKTKLGQLREMLAALA